MSDIAEGTMVRMRTMRRFSHYNAGELIAVPIEAGLELAAKRLAQPLDVLVPSSGSGTAEQPARQPTGIVKK